MSKHGCGPELCRFRATGKTVKRDLTEYANLDKCIPFGYLPSSRMCIEPRTWGDVGLVDARRGYPAEAGARDHKRWLEALKLSPGEIVSSISAYLAGHAAETSLQASLAALLADMEITG